MTFQFISNNIGPKERRLIRSHVMVGKNAGRPRPSRRKQLSIQAAQGSSPQAVQAVNRPITTKVVRSQTVNRAKPPLYDRLICNDLAFANIPQQSPEAVELLRQWLSLLDQRLYPAEFCSKLDFMDYVWLQYVFYDEGYMHGVLAIKASVSEHLDTHAETVPNALEHLSKAYKVTQKRLEGPWAISDQSIAGVTILVIYQLIHGHYETGLVHFNGLCRMIEMRGGLAKLMKHNRALAQKPWRIDLELALQSGLPMRFGTDDVFLTSPIAGSRVIYTTYTKLHEDGVSTELICILSDVVAFTDMLNSIVETSRLDPLDFSENAFSLIYRLISFAPLTEPRPGNVTEDLLQLVLLAVMTTALPTYTSDENHYDLLANYLTRALRRCVATTDEHWKLLLWAVFVGRVSVLHANHDEWIMPMIRGICQRIRIHEWSQVRQTLSGYCWIHISHDHVAVKIWKEAERRQGVHGAEA